MLLHNFYWSSSLGLKLLLSSLTNSVSTVNCASLEIPTTSPIEINMIESFSLHFAVQFHDHVLNAKKNIFQLTLKFLKYENL